MRQQQRPHQPHHQNTVAPSVLRLVDALSVSGNQEDRHRDDDIFICQEEEDGAGCSEGSYEPGRQTPAETAFRRLDDLAHAYATATRRCRRPTAAAGEGRGAPEQEAIDEGDEDTPALVVAPAGAAAGWTLLYALLHVASPTALGLLDSYGATACLARFRERVVSNLRLTSDSALSDSGVLSGAQDAALQRVGALLGVTIVVGRTDAATGTTQYRVLPPAAALDDLAVLLHPRCAGFALHVFPDGTLKRALREVRCALAVEARCGDDAASLSRMCVADLRAFAGELAVTLPSRPTKAVMAAAITAVLTGGLCL